MDPEKPDLERFGRYFRGKGYMPRTVFMYLDSAGRYLSSGKPSLTSLMASTIDTCPGILSITTLWL
jgi:hypothetical protein